MKKLNYSSGCLVVACIAFGNLTVNAEPIRIMSLGDSITAGYPLANYRSQLADKLRSVSCDVDFVGAYNDTLSTTVSSYSAIWGIAATTVDEYYIESWMKVSKPDVVLMMLGGNDVRILISPNDIMLSLSSIIDKIRLENSSAKIFVGVYPDIIKELPGMSELNKLIPKLSDKSTDKSPVVIVTHSADYNTSIGADTTDATHANVNGDSKYANNWFKALIDNNICSSSKIVYNVALNKPASASDSIYGYGSPYLAVNGLVNDVGWLRLSDGEEQVLTIDLQGKYNLNDFELSYVNVDGYKIDVKESLEDDWQSVVDEDNNNKRKMTHQIYPINANYVRLTLKPMPAGGTIIVKEFRVMGTPVSIP